MNQIAQGDHISHYRVIRQIGIGGMGVVYLAEDENLKRQVALKFLPFYMTLDEESKARLKREAQTAASLNHPNIVTIFEIGDYHGRAFIAMEYVEGQSLKDMVADGALPVNRALEITLQICDALAAAHEQGVVHRDIKPDNILFDRSGRPKILDFGLAKFTQMSLTHKDQAFGTPGYIAPEQIHCENVDHRADIFSMGVVLYEMLTGGRPFVAEKSMGVIYKILNDQPAPLSDAMEEVNSGLQEVIDLALAKNPDQRYADVKTFMRDIVLARGENQTGSFSTSFLFSGVIKSRRRKRLAWWVLALIICIAVLTWRIRSQTEPEYVVPTGTGTAIAVLPFTIRAGSEYTYLAEGMVDLMSTKFDEVTDIRSIDPKVLLGYLAKIDPDDVTEAKRHDIARRFGANFYVSGSIIEIAGTLNLDISLYDVNRPNPVAHSTAQGQSNELFTMIDNAAVDLLEGIAPEPAQRMRRLAAMTTHSFAALRAYLDGEKSFREGRFADAIDAMQNAVQEDPEFALAYYRLSMAAEWLALTGLSKQAAEKAVQQSGRLNKHDKMLLDASLAWRNGDVEGAEHLYREILDVYVDDIEAWFQLGEVRFHYGPILGQPLSASRDPFDRLIALDPDHVQALLHLMRIEIQVGNFEQFDDLAAKVTKLQPDGERGIEVEALVAYVHQDEQKISQLLKNLTQSSDTALMLTTWNIGAFAPNPFDSFHVAELMTQSHRSADTRALGFQCLSYLSMARGQWGEAHAYLEQAALIDPRAALELKLLYYSMPYIDVKASVFDSLSKELAEAADAVEIDSQNIFLTVHNQFHDQIEVYLSGIMSARSGKLNLARKFAEGMPDSSDFNVKMASSDMVVGIHMAEAMSKGDSLLAYQLAQDLNLQGWYGGFSTSPFFSRPMERYLHGVAAAKIGDLETAEKRLSSFVNYSIHDLIFVAPSHYQRGLMYENVNPPRAIEHFTAFLAMWEHADSRFDAMKADAESRLDLLGSSM